MSSNDNNLRVEDEQKLSYFLSEIKRLCEHVFISHELLEKSIYINTSNGTTYIFYYIHNMFSALGNISKILYPTKKYKDRGKRLRERLDIKDGSTQFFYDKNNEVARKYRNILEHYDEYFEDWYDFDQERNIIDCNVGPKNMIIIDGKYPRYLRHYNPEKHLFIFLDDEYDILPVIKETQEIYDKIIKIEGDRIDFTGF